MCKQIKPYHEVVNTQKLQQSPQSLVIQEGDELTISCNSSESLYVLHWYWQGNDGGPIFLVTLQKGGGKKSNDKITAKLDEKMQRSSLHIRASQPSHLGTYLCGTDAQWSADLHRLSPNLLLGHRGSADIGL
ncbi:hypothetical protein U0070_003850 [Myodes glareolus]|uniref:Ig-like domain-containing protein n=1 Tax=Myodes glareolus TaxID=447135 RepID=A0AAW0H235_MYOGA